MVDRPSAFDQLAGLGIMGDAKTSTQLRDAADWFRQRAEMLQLRASVTATLERQARGDRKMTPRQVRAAIEMKRLAERIGGEHYNRLFDLLVWDIMPLIEPRQRQTVAALAAAAAYLVL